MVEKSLLDDDNDMLPARGNAFGRWEIGVFYKNLFMTGMEKILQNKPPTSEALLG